MCAKRYFFFSADQRFQIFIISIQISSAINIRKELAISIYKPDFSLHLMKKLCLNAYLCNACVLLTWLYMSNYLFLIPPSLQWRWKQYKYWNVSCIYDNKRECRHSILIIGIIACIAKAVLIEKWTVLHIFLKLNDSKVIVIRNKTGAVIQALAHVRLLTCGSLVVFGNVRRFRCLYLCFSSSAYYDFFFGNTIKL